MTSNELCLNQLPKTIFSVLALPAFIFNANAETHSGKDQNKNVVILLIDDCSAQELGCYGNMDHKTPVMDNLAKTGVYFETCWCTPLCSPSRSELMTGRYGFRTGWYSNKNKKDNPLSDENISFFQLFKDAGYKTTIAGKWQLPGTPEKYGFNESCLWANKSELPKGIKHPMPESSDPMAWNYMFPSRYWQPSILKNGIYEPTKEDDYGPKVLSEYLIDFMKRNKKEKFVAYYSMVLTHNPWFPTPKSFTDKADKMVDKPSNFKANVEYVDFEVGKITASLKKLGLWKNTLVILMGDNGTLGVGKGKPTELGCRVPLIVSCPDMLTRNGKISELIDFTDIMPTLLNYAGIEVPKDYVHDGNSFLPLLTGKPYSEREWIYGYLDSNQMIRTKNWLLEGDGKLFFCGNNRDGKEYQEMTNSTDLEAIRIKKKLEEILLRRKAY